MKKALLPVLFLFLATVAIGATPHTMRVDYYHTGDSSHEIFSLDEVVVEPLPWPGNPNRTIDDTNLGKYLFEVRDRATNKLLYSRGFASIFGEWETTDEAKSLNRTFSESLRFPAPDAPVQIIVKKRDSQNAFREIWTLNVDPKDMFVNTAKPPQSGSVISIEKHGDSAQKVDFLILGDGYTAAQSGKCEKDAHRLTDILFATEPFKSRRTDFNVWAICAPSIDSGISRPSTGVHHRTAIGSTYDAFGSERYVLTFDNKAFREVASWAPYEFVEILANNNTYGGGGIFNLYSTVAADSLWAPYVFVHEFGHHFAGLADEYYTSDVAYTSPNERVEPWEPNVTALLNPELLKWKQFVSPDTPVPTPWNKEAFETYSREVQKQRRQIRKENRPEAEMDALFNQEKIHEEKELGAEKYAGKVGAFEGANYEAKGYYRPQTNCIMFTRANFFCKVCQSAIERVIDLYSRP